MSSDSLPEALASRPVFTTKVVSFDGTEIHYDLYDAPSERVVVVVPGFWRDRRHPAMLRLAHFITAMGLRAAVIDVRGHGESGGTYGFNLHEHHDVAAVLRDLLERAATVSSFTMLGFSYGGAIAISTAARHDLPISSLLLISSVADFERISPRINPFTIHRHIAFAQALKRPRFVLNARRSEKLRAVDDVCNLHLPICLIHVKNDWLIGHEHSLALFEAANEPKELHILDIEGNYHADRIFSVASDAIDPIVRAFLMRAPAER